MGSGVRKGKTQWMILPYPTFVAVVGVSFTIHTGRINGLRSIHSDVGMAERGIEVNDTDGTSRPTLFFSSLGSDVGNSRCAMTSLLIITFSFLFFCQTSVANLTLAQNFTRNGTQEPFRQGWTASPDGRGTLDIIWSCGFTMFLCSWSAMFLNVPSPDDTAFQIFHRKLWMTALAFLGPEFIFQISLGQYLSARRSVKAFHEAGETRWTMAHGFFVDMGGVHLQTPDWPAFPIDAKQLHYLIQKGYVECPKLHKENIEDKNKVDTLLRALTLFQILYFLANTAGRQAQNLAITVGELTTVAFIVVSTGTMWCWYYKPAEIAIPEIVVSNTSIAEIVLSAGNAADVPYIQTPLDFISRVDFPWSRYWSNWINILRHMGIVFGPQVRPVRRFENTNFLVLPGYTESLFVFMSLIYSALFICGWNYSFPTRTEQILWRTSSVTMLITVVLCWVVTECAFTLYPKLQKKYGWKPSSIDRLDVESGKEVKTAPPVNQGWFMKKIRSAAASVRNNSVTKDPGHAVPLKAMLPVYLCCFFYCCSRTYLLLADVFQLRSLPPSAYDTVKWLDYVPHF